MSRIAPATVRLLLPVALVLGCGARTVDAPVARNLLLVTVDTLRADRLGSWGYAKPTSPAIDALARESVVFTRAVAPSSWTLPSLASLMTSLYSSTHDCWGPRRSLDASHETLAEILSAAEFETGAVASHIFLGRRFGLHQGFASYDADLVQETLGQSHRAVTSAEVTAKSLRWLEQRAATNRPFFLWAHYFDPHALYLAHDGISEPFGTQTTSDRYDGEIAFTDRAIGDLLRGLATLGLADTTLVVLTADHGEEFGDHGGTDHGHSLHRELVHVPLLIRAPGIEPRRIAQTVRTIDIVPTALDLLGLAPSPEMDGSVLSPALHGRALPELPALSELRYGPGARYDSLERGRWKLIVDRAHDRASLYDLDADPDEQVDVGQSHPRIVQRLARELESLVRDARRKAARYEKAKPLQLEDDERESLRKLGYID